VNKMSKETRSEIIKKLVKEQSENKDKHTYSLTWHGENIHLPIIKVDKNFLKYRLESGRTRRKQIEYIETHPEADKNLFNDPESEKAQNAQHEILTEMIDEMGLKKDLFSEGQKFPAIITYDGFVLNGNRRLAALRYNEKMQYMDCVVLPESADPKDLFELEIDLQMARETKADYNWVDELLHLREGIENKKIKENEKILASKMKITPQQLKSKLDMLRLVDFYLAWLGKPGKYFLFGEKDEQVFIELEKFSRKLKTPEQQKLVREIVFSILKNPPTEGRLYRHVSTLFKNYGEVLKNFEKKLNKPKLELREKKEIKRPSEVSNDPLKELAGKDEKDQKKKMAIELSPFFSNPELGKKNIELLIESSEDAEANLKDRKDRSASYDRVSDAQRQLQGVIIESSTMDMEGIENKLKEIIFISNELIKEIGRVRGIKR
jgi:hypothetical protein